MPTRPKDPRGKSQVFKRSIRLDGHRTSVSLETAFWDELKGIADAQGVRVLSRFLPRPRSSRAGLLLIEAPIFPEIVDQATRIGYAASSRTTMVRSTLNSVHEPTATVKPSV
jgi:hypothetical protein